MGILRAVRIIFTHPLKVEEDRIIKVKQYIEAYEEVQNLAKNDVDKYIGNPLNSYLLIKRLTSDWKEVKNLMSSKVTEDSFANMTDSYERPLKWPSEDDLSGAAIALTRLQDTYNLSPSDMSQGNLHFYFQTSHLSILASMRVCIKI